MSKTSVSPYRRNVYNNKLGVPSFREEPYKLSEKSKLSHSFIADHNTEKKPGVGREETLRLTDKKKSPDYGVGHSRLETLMEQNKFLLSQNNELANLLNDRNRIIIALEQKLDQQIAQEVQTLEEIQFEKNRFLEEYGQRTRQHSARNQCLMDQIAQLNQDIYQLEVRKNREIEHIKESYSREHKTQLENILSNHAQTVQLMNIEVSKLKEMIGSRDHEIECLNHELKSTHDRLKGKCQQLQRNLAHALHMKKLELSDTRLHYQKIIQNIKRENQKVQEVNNNQYEHQIKRIKKQLLARQIEVEKLGNDMSSNHIDSQTKINELYQKKGELEQQISQLESCQKALIFQQTQRINALAQAELENNNDMNKQLMESLRSENAKLAQLNETRGNQITKLYIQIEDLRFKNEREGDDLRLQIDNLKALIQNEKLSEQQKNQAFKVKIAYLRHADIHSLQEYYQNELATMVEDLQAKQQIIKESRDKIHAEIQEKTEMRKNFEIEVSKLKIRIGELELKIAGAMHERKEDIASFGSQMQLTSMSLLRTAEEKEKYALFSQSQKLRLQKMIQNKDREIEQLNDKIKLMNQNHGVEVANKDQKIQNLKKTIQELQSNLKKEKFFLENEVKKKEAINRNEKQYYESEINKVKRQTADEYNRILAELTNQKGIIESERVNLKKMSEQLSEQLKQIKQLREQQNLDKDIAINQSMGRIATEKQILEVSLRSYFRKELDAKDIQIKNLKQQIAELNIDVRAHMEKEQKLQSKLLKLLQSQQKLRDMEQRVLVLGQENNIVKNLGEIVKRRK